jgi:hypothetical protein
MKRTLILFIILSVHIFSSPLKSMPSVGYTKKMLIDKFQEDTTLKKKKISNIQGSALKYRDKQKLSLILATRELNRLIEPWKVNYNNWNNNKKFIK